LSSLKKSIGLALVTQYAELVIQFVGVLILARIISPEEIGIYSVAAFLMAILHVFRDFGVAKYVIKEDELSTEKIRAAFGVAIILAWAIALVLFASSRWIADFYDKPEIENILIVMSASFAITPMGSVLTAIFRREMQLKKILVVRVSSSVCHVVVAVVLALHGFGAISLAWANFAGILAFGIAATAMRGSNLPWLPSFNNIREILSFGSVASLGSVVGVAGTNAPDVIIGKVINLAAAGYFSRANGLIQMFRTLVSGAIVPLILPYFAKLKRENGDMVQPYFLAVQYLTVFAWPFFAVMALLALPVVRTLYGLQWDASVPIVKVLCFAGAVSTLATFAGEVMIAYGHIRKVTKAQIIVQPVRILAILFASSQGLLAIAIAMIVSECFSVAIISHLLQRTTGVRFQGVLRATGKSAIVTICSVLAPAATEVFWSANSLEWLELIVGVVGAFAGWVVGILWTGHPMKSHLHLAWARLVSKTGTTLPPGD
jgi:O-antigen/teichoic acid export membrane protein